MEEANRDYHSSMFQIGEEVKAPTETQYPEDEEVEDLVPKESLPLVLMFVQVLAGFYVEFLIMTPNILLIRRLFQECKSGCSKRCR